MTRVDSFHHRNKFLLFVVALLFLLLHTQFSNNAYADDGRQSARGNSISQEKSESSEASVSGASAASNFKSHLKKMPAASSTPPSSSSSSSSQVPPPSPPPPTQKQISAMTQRFMDALLILPYPDVDQAVAICQSKILPHGIGNFLEVVSDVDQRYTHHNNNKKKNHSSRSSSNNKQTKKVPNTESHGISVTDFLLARLHAKPTIIRILSCLVETDIINVTALPDQGAGLLFAAVARKHLGLTSALVQRSASLGHDGFEIVVPPPSSSLNDSVAAATQSIPTTNTHEEVEEGRGGVDPQQSYIPLTLFHSALSVDLLMIDMIQNLLKVHSPSSILAYTTSQTRKKELLHNRTALALAVFEAATAYPKWLGSIVVSMNRHLPDSEGSKVAGALDKLLQESPLTRTPLPEKITQNNETFWSARIGVEVSRKIERQLLQLSILGFIPEPLPVPSPLPPAESSASTSSNATNEVNIDATAEEKKDAAAPVPAEPTRRPPIQGLVVDDEFLHHPLLSMAALTTVDTHQIRAIANGIASLILRLLLDAKLPPNATTTTTVDDENLASQLLRTPREERDKMYDRVSQGFYADPMSRVLAVDGLGRTPLHIAAASGNMPAALTILHHISAAALRERKATGATDPNLLAQIKEYINKPDGSGRSSLDLACVYGHDHLIGLLVYGRKRKTLTTTELDQGCAMWRLPSAIRNKRKGGRRNKHNEGEERQEEQGTTENKKNEGSDGGWGSRSTTDATTTTTSTSKHGMDDDRCDFQVVSSSLSAETFYESYYLRNIPVVIRGLALNWPQRKTWTRENMMRVRGKAVADEKMKQQQQQVGEEEEERLLDNNQDDDDTDAEGLGDVAFLAGSIPYAHAFGIGGDAGNTTTGFEKQQHYLPSKPLTIRDYILAMYECGESTKNTSLGSDDDDDEFCQKLGFSVSTTNTTTAPLYIFDSPASSSAISAGVSLANRGVTSFEETSSSSSSSSSSKDRLVQNITLVPPFAQKNILIRTKSITKLNSTSTTNDDDNNSNSTTSLHMMVPSASFLPLVRYAPSVVSSPKIQFYLGAQNTGAPMHIHKDAWNALIYGKKKWYLLPSSVALYSTVPANEWVREVERIRREEEENKRDDDDDDDGDEIAEDEDFIEPNTTHYKPLPGVLQRRHKQILECTQHPGDVIYVPHGWGHAVLNQEVSVGFAVEFSTLFAG